MGDESQLQETGNPGIVLSVLTSIERDSTITQRKLANELGIALGLANAYLRRCVRKGLIKMSQVPLNRYAYYLTPQGFAEKSRLTAEYLAVSLDFFRRSRSDCVALFRQCEALGWRRVALYGAGDLAEIAILSASETAVEVICVIDSRLAGRRSGGLPIVAGPRSGIDVRQRWRSRRYHPDRHSIAAGEFRHPVLAGGAERSAPARGGRSERLAHLAGHRGYQ